MARLITEHLHRLGKVREKRPLGGGTRATATATATAQATASAGARAGTAVLRVGTGTLNHFPGPPGSPMSPDRVHAAAAAALPGTPLAAAAATGDFQPLVFEDLAEAAVARDEVRAVRCGGCGVYGVWCV